MGVGNTNSHGLSDFSEIGGATSRRIDGGLGPMPSQAIPEEDSAPGVAATPVAVAPWRVKSFAVLPGLRLGVTFIDDRKGVIDCSGILGATHAGIDAAIADEKFFAQARIELGAITWPSGADLDPLWSYEELAGRRSWSAPFCFPF